MAFYSLVPEVEMVYGNQQTLDPPGQRLQASPTQVISFLIYGKPITNTKI